MQGWTTTTRYGVISKRRRKGWKGYSKAVGKEPKKEKPLLTLDLFTVRS